MDVCADALVRGGRHVTLKGFNSLLMYFRECSERECETEEQENIAVSPRQAQPRDIEHAQL